MLKPAVSFLFIFLIFLVNSSYFVFIGFMKSEKSAFRTQAFLNSNSKLTKISMPYQDLYIDKNGLEWKEGGKEIVLHGKFNEVIKKEYKKGLVILYLLPDYFETELLSDYFKLKPIQDYKNIGLLFSFFNLNYLPDQNKLTFSFHSWMSVDFTESLSLTAEGIHRSLFRPPSQLA